MEKEDLFLNQCCEPTGHGLSNEFLLLFLLGQNFIAFLGGVEVGVGVGCTHLALKTGKVQFLGVCLRTRPPPAPPALRATP